MQIAQSLAWAAVGVCGALSFICALAETALFSLGKWRLHQLQQQPSRAAKIVASLLAKPQDLLATIVLGNTFANAGLVTVGLGMAFTYQWPKALAMAGVLLLILVGCEVIPKTLAVRAPDRWSLRLAYVIAVLQKTTSPLRHVAQALSKAILWVMPKSVKPQPGLTEEEYRELLEMAYQQGSLAQSEKEIILQIINLDRRTAQEVMRPRAQMACISDDLSIEEMVEAARRLKHRRLPVYDGTPDTIVGILNTRALLLNPQIDLADAIEFPSFVPESMNLLKLLQSLQRQQRGLAMVLDEFGSTAGLVTIQDILEAIIGEIRREGETPGFVMEKISDGKWRVNGVLRLDDFRRHYPALGSVPGVETMGGLLTAQLEVVPQEGQSVVFRGLRLTARSVDERRVRELLVEVTRR